MPSWPPKDPDAVLDYTYTIPLDEGDSVSDHDFAIVSGTVVVDSEDIAGAVVTATLSGGEEGETSVFRISWVTAAGREDDDFITIAIVANEPLELTGYAKPTPAHLTTRYPAFADVPTQTIHYWLTDAERMVDESWTEGDYAAALMALAAHNMTLIGLGTGAEAEAAAAGASGFKVMRSGSLTLERFDNDSGSTSGSFGGTAYGSQFAALLARNRGGPRVSPTGSWPVPNSYPYRPF